MQQMLLLLPISNKTAKKMRVNQINFHKWLLYFKFMIISWSTDETPTRPCLGMRRKARASACGWFLLTITANKTTIWNISDDFPRFILQDVTSTKRSGRVGRPAGPETTGVDQSSKLNGSHASLLLVCFV